MMPSLSPHAGGFPLGQHVQHAMPHGLGFHILGYPLTAPPRALAHGI